MYHGMVSVRAVAMVDRSRIVRQWIGQMSTGVLLFAVDYLLVGEYGPGFESSWSCAGPDRKLPLAWEIHEYLDDRVGKGLLLGEAGAIPITEAPSRLSWSRMIPPYLSFHSKA